MNQADEALLSQRFEEAIENYLKGLKHLSSKNVSKIWDDLGYAYLRKKKLALAISYLHRAREAFPANFDIRFYLAAAHLLDDKIGAASEELEKIEENIHFDDSWLQTAWPLKIKNMYGDEISKDDLERLKNEKGVYLEIEKPATATLHIDAFDEENEALFFFVKGLVSQKLGHPGEAEKRRLAAAKAGFDEEKLRSWQSRPLAEIGVLIHHRLKGHNNNLAWFAHDKFLQELHKGAIEEAIKILEKALDINEESFEMNCNLGILYFDQRNLEEAEKYCARALWFREKDLGSHELMGNIYFYKKDYQRALHDFLRMLEIDERNAPAHYNLGSAYYMLNLWPSAENQWKRAIECDSLAALGPEKQTSPEGELAFSVLVKKTPISYLSHKSLGNLYSEQKLFDKAILEFEEAIKLRPDEADPYLELGRIYLDKNEKESAISCLEKYLFLGGEKQEEVKKLMETIKK